MVCREQGNSCISLYSWVAKRRTRAINSYGILLQIYFPYTFKCNLLLAVGKRICKSLIVNWSSVNLLAIPASRWNKAPHFFLHQATQCESLARIESRLQYCGFHAKRGVFVHRRHSLLLRPTFALRSASIFIRFRSSLFDLLFF